MSLKQIRWLVMAILWGICLPAFGQTFTIGKVTYEPRGSGEVAVKKITLPNVWEVDSLVIAIPEKVSNDSTQYTVTTIGTEDGTSVMIYPDTIHFTTLTVEIPGSVNKLYAKALNASNEDVGRRVRVFFKPNNNLKSWPEGMFSGTRFKALKLPQGV